MSSTSLPDPVRPVSPTGRLTAAIGNGITRVTDRALGPYQSAIVRIGFSATWLLFLLREFPHRRELYGPEGPWSWELAQQLIATNDAFTVLMWSDSMVWFEIVYAVAVLAAFLLLLGWRTRAVSVLFMVGVLSLQNRSVFMGDGGDNVLHLMAIYLVFVRCAQVWSLDARRARRGRERLERDGRAPEDRVGPVLWCVLGFALLVATFGGLIPGGDLVPGGWLTFFWGLWVVHALWWAACRIASDTKPRALLDIVGNLTHNAALVVIMAEACLIYAAAGWYKIQGARWQDGTAAYYPFHLDYFSPWAALSDLLSSSGTMVMLVTYGTVIVQVAFPFTLFNRRVKNVLLAVMMTEHAVIAVVLGLPFFSLAMIAADAVFLPTPFLKRLGGLVARARDRVVRRVLPGRIRTIPGPRDPSQPPLPQEKETAEQAHVGFTA
ncbi:HTTM domain-containing protein [Streptomyces europaeiscabiei]|uniref:HTTM domain-containing protein n=1 Tax=Streptomyces europaeiscabiei TaxID=146819 RepID=A0ABU4NLR2_9ACTN|nr:HTTM domain-containing protein [Streptomyces europaeiscabiei]MDX3545015.1 HTTM domain-containing protein [Streptomyces europaeiscabiei]MDX3554703.1 HTTM domain-containing protein [Streptomyces europaeiscabiei]MDX3702395.1 HTTM domain-containing protein [Streptomyces europaeiscabiei]